MIGACVVALVEELRSSIGRRKLTICTASKVPYWNSSRCSSIASTAKNCIRCDVCADGYMQFFSSFFRESDS